MGDSAPGWPTREGVAAAEWATVQEIDFGLTRLTADGTLRVVTSPNLRALASIVGATPLFFQRLLAGQNEAGLAVDAARHRALLARIRRLGGRDRPAVSDIEAFHALALACPNLEEITWSASPWQIGSVTTWLSAREWPAHVARYVQGSGKARVVFDREPTGRLTRPDPRA